MTNASNHDIAGMLRLMAEFLAMQDVPFKPRAYEKAAMTVEEFEEPLADVYKTGGVKGLMEIPGIGAGIAGKIEEFLKTGRVKELEGFKKKMPVDLSELSKVEGLGPKSVKTLYQKLGVTNLEELEKVAREGKISKLAGFGSKSEEKILANIAFAKTTGLRLTLGAALPLARALEAKLKDVPGVGKLIVAGSLRRRKETIGDIDVLATSSKPKAVMDHFVSLPEVAHVIAHGETKSSVKFRSGLNVDLRVVPAESYGAALNYFTGSKEHNVALRTLVVRKGWKLNEYGLFKVESRKSKVESDGEKRIAGITEEEIYSKLGLDYIEPELRENTGEIEAARTHTLPKIIGYGDLQGDLQVQTDWTDGSDSILTMAKAAQAAGLKYMAVTDHTKRLAMTHGLDEKRIVEQWAEIDRVNKKFGGTFKVLKGSECDILKDGSLDLKDEILAKLDVVGVSVHSYFNLPQKEQTDRIIRAIRNPHADILFHPTGRILNRRPPYELDMEAVIAAAEKTHTIMEIDALDRLDLKDEHIRLCVEAGVPMAIDSDAHSPLHFSALEYGIAQARRGWAEKKDVINAWPVEKMLKSLKNH
jgi:DNA polymerase (family 10)